MLKTKLAEQDALRGARFRLVRGRLFPGQPRNAVGRELGGVSGGTIRNWENGYPISAAALARLEELGVSPSYILSGEGWLPGDGPDDGFPTSANRPPRGGRPSGEPGSAADADVPSPAGAPTPPGEAEDAAGGPSPAEDPRWMARVVGANLRRLRDERFPGWGGQKRFAEFLGISANDLCQYEYGRQLAGEERLADMARRLGLAPEALREPPPLLSPPPPLPPRLAAPGAGEKAWRERVRDLENALARAEGKNDALNEQLGQQERRLRELQEANTVLKGLLFARDAEEAREWRERLFERLGPSIADLLGRGESL